jgi:hypothetical protein
MLIARSAFVVVGGRGGASLRQRRQYSRQYPLASHGRRRRLTWLVLVYYVPMVVVSVVLIIWQRYSRRGEAHDHESSNPEWGATFDHGGRRAKHHNAVSDPSGAVPIVRVMLARTWRWLGRTCRSQPIETELIFGAGISGTRRALQRPPPTATSPAGPPRCRSASRVARRAADGRRPEPPLAIQRRSIRGGTRLGDPPDAAH